MHSRKEESCGVKLCTFFFSLVLSLCESQKKKIILTNTTCNLENMVVQVQTGPSLFSAWHKLTNQSNENKTRGGGALGTKALELRSPHILLNTKEQTPIVPKTHFVCPAQDSWTCCLNVGWGVHVLVLWTFPIVCFTHLHYLLGVQSQVHLQGHDLDPAVTTGTKLLCCSGGRGHSCMCTHVRMRVCVRTRALLS